jgi:hypothetical protein
MTDFEPYNFLRFCEEVVKLKDNIYYLIVGNDLSAERWLRLFTRSGEKVRPLGELDKANVVKIMAIADFYVDSFLCGSLSCILEALSFGLPALTLKTVFTAGNDTLTPLVFDSIESMTDYINSYVKGEVDYALTAKEIAQKLEAMHYKDSWVEIMNAVVYGNAPNHSVDTAFCGFAPQITKYEECIKPFFTNEDSERTVLHYALEKL